MSPTTNTPTTKTTTTTTTMMTLLPPLLLPALTVLLLLLGGVADAQQQAAVGVGGGAGAGRAASGLASRIVRDASPETLVSSSSSAAAAASATTAEEESSDYSESESGESKTMTTTTTTFPFPLPDHLPSSRRLRRWWKDVADAPGSGMLFLLIAVVAYHLASAAWVKWRGVESEAAGGEEGRKLKAKERGARPEEEEEEKEGTKKWKEQAQGNREKGTAKKMEELADDDDPDQEKEEEEGVAAAAVATGGGEQQKKERRNEEEEKEQQLDDGGGEEEIVIEDSGHIDRGFLKSVEVGFEDLRMTLRQKKKSKKGKKNKDGDGDDEERVILDGSIKGKARPGRMLAIMGPSGSGKSTVIHALAGRIKENSRLTLSGSRYINGEPLSGDSQLPAAFIEQEVNFFPHMTVKETLDFRVELRLGTKLGRSARDDIVERLMRALGLSKSANTIVGNSKIRGLSGGERKRLSIACEMISSPPVIFLDEPTSGLDSYQASQVVSTLRDLATRDGKTVVAVIHQPSQHVFGMFDDLLLISEGRLMYFGEVNEVRGYMTKRGFGCEDEMGTAEHVLELVSRVNGGDEGASRRSVERIDKLAEEARAAVADVTIGTNGNGDGNGNGNGGNKVAKSTNATGEKKRRNNHNHKKKKKKKKHIEISHVGGANIFRQFRLLLVRAFDEVLRGKGAILIKVVQQVSIAAIYGGIYHLGNNQASIMDRIGLLSLIVIGATNMATAGTIRSFPKEKAIVANEISDRLYTTLPYFVAKAISEIPLIGVYQAIFSSIIYPLTGLQKGRFRTFLGLTTLHTIMAEAAGLLIGAISPNSDVALALFPPLIVLNIIFDGKNISEENTPPLLRWIPKVGLIRWAFEGLAVNEFEGLTFVTSGPPRGPVAKTGKQALERFGLGTRTVGEVVRAQVNIVGVCWVLSWLGLSLTRQKFQVMKEPPTTR